MTADLPNELIELLEKIVLQNSEFSDNRNLQNLLILTAIKADKEKVMDYIQRLNNYDMPDIANIAVGSELYEEALVIFKKAELHREAAKVLIDYIASMERATEFAEKVDVEEVWVMLGKAQLAALDVPAAIASFIKANDASEYVAVIGAADSAGCHSDLCTYLVMCRKKVKEAHIDTSLIYAYAKSEQYAVMEEFISAPNVGRIQDVAERCYTEAMYEAAKLLFTSISNFSRLATCLMHLGQHQAAVDAARKANSTRTWKEVNASCVKHEEFRLAQICALHIIVNPDELEELISVYEQGGHFDEVIAVMEAGLGLERAHMGIFTELGCLYSKYKESKLMEHIKLFWSRLNIRKMLKACEEGAQWGCVVFLYVHYDEFDNAVTCMIAHPSEAWEPAKFKEILPKVTNTEIFYKAVDFYLALQPTMLNDLLAQISQRVRAEHRNLHGTPLARLFLGFETHRRRALFPHMAGRPRARRFAAAEGGARAPHQAVPARHAAAQHQGGQRRAVRALRAGRGPRLSRRRRGRVQQLRRHRDGAPVREARAAAVPPHRRDALPHLEEVGAVHRPLEAGQGNHICNHICNHIV